MKEQSVAKRIFDITGSVTGLIMLSPLFLITAIIIKLTGRGSVFFRQRRIGKEGIPFMLCKFRTMTPSGSAGNDAFEPGNTSRVTRTGLFLRRTKLDELPQLINVLRGEMSLVGPRPEVEEWVRVYPEKWQRILTVRPGITDPASIEFRDEEKILTGCHDPSETYLKVILPRKLELNISYVDNNTVMGDIRLIMRTLKKLAWS